MIARDLTLSHTVAEEQFQSIMEITAEGVWRLAFKLPVVQDHPVDYQVNHIYTHGYIAACNAVFAEQIAGTSPDVLRNRPVRQVMPHIKPLIKAFVQSGYRLKNKRHSITSKADVTRHYTTSLIGTSGDNELTTVWGSFREITERVVLKNRLLTALEEQQQQFGRELHDGVGQLLTGLRILGEHLMDELPPECPREKHLADRIIGFAREASEQVYQLKHGLASAPFTKETLSAALKKLAKTTDGLPGIACTFSGEPAIDIYDRQRRAHVYRIAQEALNNALRHGSPQHIRLTLTQTNARTLVTIEDDGIGFKPEETENHGLGLETMRYRADVLGADLEINSIVDHGTTIRCSLSTT